MDAKISNLQIQVNEIRVDIKKSQLDTTKIEVIGFDKLVLKYELHIPLKTTEEFSSLDSKVVGQFHRDLKEHIESNAYEYEEVKDSISGIFRRFFKKAVLDRYTAKQKGKDETRELFGKTEFSKCLHGALTQVYAPRLKKNCEPDEKIPKYDERICLTAIGKVIKDARDWDKGREERRSKQKNEVVRTLDNPSSKKRVSNMDENDDESLSISPAKQSRSSDNRSDTESILKENSLVLNAE
ncbi:hypothetical protein QAD02_020143 [Eretmocerus hayati]|uniref:Uncharacterized protein n=1 Tax=Eretmocerus hayati TaxID=131215 RepID=A0ACC2PLJ2_9HYME|nr:hypothetical protein QAD02_020143 [Eretmocerus hayati]